MRLQDYDTNQRFEASVVSTERITPDDSPDDVRELVLEFSDPAFSPRVGQNIGILAPGRQEFGQEYHLRLYSIAGIPEKGSNGGLRFPICVRRCTYIDEYSGERYNGRASNYLCDLKAGDTITVTGPYGLAFQPPSDHEATLILIGAGTGIAPFRAFIKHLYHEDTDFNGRVILFHGGRTGLELLYMNDERNDFAQYMDHETFEAVAALAHRPHWTDAIDWNHVIGSRSEEIWNLLSDQHTRVYLAGLVGIRDELDTAFSKIAGSSEKWAERKQELAAEGRWIELLY